MAMDLVLAAHTFSGLCFNKVHLHLQRQLVGLGISQLTLEYLLLGGRQHHLHRQLLWCGYQLL
jgi:hypothetical protein